MKELFTLLFSPLCSLYRYIGITIYLIKFWYKTRPTITPHIGNVIGLQTVIEIHALGRYIGPFFCIWFLIWTRNEKLDANLNTKVEKFELADLTDKPNPNFRYAYCHI